MIRERGVARGKQELRRGSSWSAWLGQASSVPVASGTSGLEETAWDLGWDLGWDLVEASMSARPARRLMTQHHGEHVRSVGRSELAFHHEFNNVIHVDSVLIHYTEKRA